MEIDLLYYLLGRGTEKGEGDEMRCERERVFVCGKMIKFLMIFF